MSDSPSEKAQHAGHPDVPPSTPLVSYACGVRHDLVFDNATLLVREHPQGPHSRWLIGQGRDGGLTLEWHAGTAKPPPAHHVLAALDGAFTQHRASREIAILADGDVRRALRETAVCLPFAGDDAPRVCRDMLWQAPELWLPQVRQPRPLRYTLTQGRRHPVRADKLGGTVYQRFIPWLGKTFSFRGLDMETDLPLIHQWMNEPAVARIWQEDGDLAKHRAYLQGIEQDPHMQSLMACLDGQPFGYFEVYWAKENRIAPFYDVDDHDRGWHVLIGDPAFRGKAYATAWLTSISHYLFLCDPRTQRVVGEPRADHAQQIRNLDKSGYAKVKEFDFPHKRALLVTVLRERYFGDAYWWPRDDEPARPSHVQS